MTTPTARISRIAVTNFRCLREFDLTLQPGSPAVLIGPNNAGKSTLLDAIGICLGSAKASKYLASDDDFWRAASGAPADEYTIEVFLEATSGALPAVKGGIGDPVDVHSIRVTATRGESSIDRRLLDKDGNEILLPKSTPVSKAKQDSYRGMGFGGRTYAKLVEIAKWIPDVWHLDSKTLYPSLYDWKSGPLQKLLGYYKTDLLTKKWKTKSGKEMPEMLHTAHKFLVEQALPTPYWRDTLYPKLKEKFAQYLGAQAGFEMTPGLSPVDDWILSQLKIQVTPASGLASVESRRLGDGWQSLLRMASLELLLELGKKARVLLLLEEPETYLHPHLRRRFRAILHRLQAAGHQCIVATHSPELISFAEPQHIVRLRMTTNGSVRTEYTTASAEQSVKDEEKLFERGNHEMVFSNVAVLLEGKDDQYAVRMGLQALNVDLDALSISLVDCGSVDNLPGYASICARLGIPWIAIHDRDLQADGTQKANTKASAAKLAGLKASHDLVCEWDNDLEAVLACHAGKATPQWINANYGSKGWAELSSNTALSKYCKVVDAVRNHLSSTFLT